MSLLTTHIARSDSVILKPQWTTNLVLVINLYYISKKYFYINFIVVKQVPMLRNLEYVACYYITGSYKSLDYGYCVQTKNYRDLAYAVSFLPYYWRAMQVWKQWVFLLKILYLVMDKNETTDISMLVWVPLFIYYMT